MKKKLCKNCQYYFFYYRRWSANFGRLSHGWCRRFEKHQEQFDACDDYKENTEYELMKEKKLFKSLEQALTSIDHIAQILKEKQDEDQEK